MNKYVRLEDIQKRIGLSALSDNNNTAEFLRQIWSELPIVEIPDIISVNDNKINLPNGATPMSIADVVIREAKERDWLEDVVHYIQCYIDREWGESENQEELTEKFEKERDCGE